MFPRKAGHSRLKSSPHTAALRESCRGEIAIRVCSRAEALVWLFQMCCDRPVDTHHPKHRQNRMRLRRPTVVPGSLCKESCTREESTASAGPNLPRLRCKARSRAQKHITRDHSQTYRAQMSRHVEASTKRLPHDITTKCVHMRCNPPPRNVLASHVSHVEMIRSGDGPRLISTIAWDGAFASCFSIAGVHVLHA